MFGSEQRTSIPDQKKAANSTAISQSSGSEIKLPVYQEIPESRAEKPPLQVSNELTAKQVILAVVIGMCLILFSAALLSQAVLFPETSFELFAFWGGVAGIYLIVLLWLFKSEI